MSYKQIGATNQSVYDSNGFAICGSYLAMLIRSILVILLWAASALLEGPSATMRLDTSMACWMISWPVSCVPSRYIIVLMGMQKPTSFAYRNLRGLDSWMKSTSDRISRTLYYFYLKFVLSNTN